MLGDAVANSLKAVGVDGTNCEGCQRRRRGLNKIGWVVGTFFRVSFLKLFNVFRTKPSPDHQAAINFVKLLNQRQLVHGTVNGRYAGSYEDLKALDNIHKKPLGALPVGWKLNMSGDKETFAVSLQKADLTVTSSHLGTVNASTAAGPVPANFGYPCSWWPPLGCGGNCASNANQIPKNVCFCSSGSGADCGWCWFPKNFLCCGCSSDCDAGCGCNGNCTCGCL